MEYAIRIKNLSYSYEEDFEVIKNLSFDVLKGKYTCILGHNGSGKSTLAKLILGLLEANSGEIEVLGDILSVETVNKIRREVGIVFQNPDNQFIGSTVEDDIAFGLENRCVETEKMKDIIYEYASKVDMLSYLQHEPTNLSGGQKQRVAIAGVLAMAPKIILFDEATSMLDPKGKAEILELIRKMKDIVEDVTVISISHDVEEAMLADEIIVLNNGKIERRGTPREIFKDINELKNISLDAPFIYKLQEELKKLGNDVDVSSLEEVLCQ